MQIYEYRRMPSKIPTTVFGLRLKEARVRAGLPQDKLGVRIGLDEGTASARLSRYETGVHEPSFHTVVQIARELQVPAAYFYCEDDELANLILLWERASIKEKRRIKAIINAELVTQ